MAVRAAGVNFVDTADSYFWRAPGNSGGESEALIGEWMDSRGNRDAVVVATKVGSWPQRKGLSAKNIAEAVDDVGRGGVVGHHDHLGDDRAGHSGGDRVGQQTGQPVQPRRQSVLVDPAHPHGSTTASA